MFQEFKGHNRHTRMDQLHDLCLQRHHTYLLDKLDPDGVLSYLYQEGFLTSDELSMINAERTRKSRAYQLLERLHHSAPNAFDAFIDSLSRTNQHFIADKLLKDLDELRGLHRFVSDLLRQILVNILFLHH